MDDIAKLGFDINSKPLEDATDKLLKFSKAGKEAQLVAGAVKTAMGIAAATTAIFVTGITGAVMRLEEMDKLVRQVDRALANTGNTARTSGREIQEWAEQIEYRTGRAAEEVVRASTNLATYGFGRETFYRALELANDMSAAWGGDLKQNLEGLSRALDDPEKGFAMLQKRGVQLNDTQKELVATLLDANDKFGAQKVVLEALEGQVKGVAEEGFGGLTAAISRGQEAWEAAFEELVEGDGIAGDLRDKLVELVQTISSPEFINSIMQMGGVFVQVLVIIANGIINVINNLRMLGDLMANLGGNVAGMSDGGLDGRMRDLGMKTLDLEKRRIAAESVLAKGGDVEKHFARGDLETIKNEAAEVLKQEQEILRIRKQREESSTPPAMIDPLADWDGFDPYKGETFGSKSGNKASSEASDAYDNLIKKTNERVASLTLEAEAMGLVGVQAQSLVNLQTLIAEAEATGVAMTEPRLAQLAELAEQLTDAELTLEGLQITMANQTPWDVMAEGVTRLNELMERGKITASDYWAEMGKAADTMVGAYSSAASGIIGQAEKLTDALGLQGKEAFEANKAISIANAVVSGGEAIVKSYNWGTTLGGPIGGALAAGLAAAATAAQIGAIASSTYQSKSIASPSSSAAIPATGAGGGGGNVANFNIGQGRATREELEQIVRGLRDLDRDSSTKFLLNGSEVT